MKQMILIGVLMSLALSIGGCSNNTDLSTQLKKEGIAPVELNERDHNLLQSFDLVSHSQILAFKAPKEATTLMINTYFLNKDGEWVLDLGSGGISIGPDRKPTETLQGTFTMTVKEDYSIDYHINSAGGYSMTKELDSDLEFNISAKQFLTNFQEIKLNEEIPVAIMAYSSGGSMRSFDLNTYYEPDVFKGIDVVQAVTLTFTDK